MRLRGPSCSSLTHPCIIGSIGMQLHPLSQPMPQQPLSRMGALAAPATQSACIKGRGVVWQVIGRNIKSSGDLNPMLPGRRVTGIFGFCDIRQFTDATEVLQEEVMEFVNSIAKIVHLEVGWQPDGLIAHRAACRADGWAPTPAACLWQHHQY